MVNFLQDNVEFPTHKYPKIMHTGWYQRIEVFMD